MVRGKRPFKKTTGLRNWCVLSTKYESCTYFEGTRHIKKTNPGGQNFCVREGVPCGCDCRSTMYGGITCPFKKIINLSPMFEGMAY